MQDTKQKQNEVRENILTTFRIHELPEEEQEEATIEIGKLIYQMTLIRVLPLLPKSELEKYDKMMEGAPAPYEIIDFLFERVPEFFEIVAQETENFRLGAVEILNKVKK